jgi:hypothetical protein
MNVTEVRWEIESLLELAEDRDRRRVWILVVSKLLILLLEIMIHRLFNDAVVPDERERC